MSADLRDPLDVQIDEVLAGMMAGHPRRVNAASVRAAIEAEPRRAAFGARPWLALAAALVLAFTFALRTRTARPSASIATPGVLASGANRVTAETGPGSGSATAAAGATSAVMEPTLGRRRAVARNPGPEEVPPFPRLDVASIDRPEPLAPGALQAEALLVPRMDTTPLLLTTLNQDQELHP